MAPGRRAVWFAALAGLGFLAGLSPASDSDIWWHLAAGREMWRTGGFLRVDPFSLDAGGRPWTNLHWLFQLGAYAIHSAGGLLAVVVAKAVAVATGAVLLAIAVCRGSRGSGDPGEASSLRVLVVLLPAALLFVRHLILVRPVVVTLVYLAAVWLIVESYRTDGRPRRLLWLPVVQVAWTNTQGLFALGPIVVACFVAGELVARALGRRELPPGGAWRLSAAGAAMLVASVANPYGIRALALPLELFARLLPGRGNVFSAHIAENVPPWVLERTAPGHMLPFGAMLVVSALGFFVAGRRLVWGRVLLVLAFAGLAAIANRNLLLFHWVAAPVAALHLGPALARRFGQAGRATDGPRPWPRWRLLTHALPMLPAVAVAGLSVVACLALANEPALGEPAPFRAPRLGVALLQRSPPGGRIFAADHYGGYLIWNLYPRHRPYIDTRLVLRTADEYREFLGLLDYPERWEGFVEHHPVDFAVLPSAFPDRYLGLIRHLHRSPRWRLCATDGTEVIFALAPAGEGGSDREPCQALDLGDADAVERITAGLAPVTTEVGRAARRHLGRLLLVLEQHRQGQAILRTLPEEDTRARVLLAHSLLRNGEVAEAERVARDLLDREAEESAAFTILAMIALGRGEPKVALDFLGEAFEHDPYNQEAEALLVELEAEERRRSPRPPSD